MLPRRPATSWKKKGGGLLREPASHFPVMRHFCWDAQKKESAVDHAVCYKRNQRLCGVRNDQTDLPSQVALLQPAWSGMMNRVSSPSAPLLTLGHHVKACTNQATALFSPFTLLSMCTKQIHKASLETDANTLTHARIPTKDKQNQADLRSFCERRTIMPAHTNTHSCNPCYDAIAVRGFTAAPTAGIPHWQL